MPNVQTTVAIVGAGPTGLLLAGDLAQAGVDVTLLERRDTESNLTRAFGVHARLREVACEQQAGRPGTHDRDGGLHVGHGHTSFPMG